jgi:hypothetical protein
MAQPPVGGYQQGHCYRMTRSDPTKPVQVLDAGVLNNGVCPAQTWTADEIQRILAVVGGGGVGFGGDVGAGIQRAGDAAVQTAKDAADAAKKSAQAAQKLSDLADKVWGKLSDPALWKATGLLLVAAVLGLVGLLIWFRKDVEAGAEAGGKVAAVA